MRSRLSAHCGGVDQHGMRDGLVALALGIVAFWQLLPAVATTPFHRDEARWLHRASYLREWRDPLGPRWQDGGYPAGEGTADELNRMRGQPPLGSYLIGLGLLLQGRDLSTNGFWNMERDEAWNAARGNVPDAADLRAGRRTSVAVAALTVAVVYLLGRRLTSRVGGATGALLLAFHPLLLDTATRAWADPLLVLLVALAALAAVRLGERPSRGRALLLGALLGLGGATKLSPLLVALPLGAFGAALLLAARLGGRPADVRVGRHLLAVPLVAFAVFVAVYPYLWRDPLGHTRNLFAYRIGSFQGQATNWPESGVPTRTEALRRVGAQLSYGSSTSGRLAAAAARSPAIPIRRAGSGVDLDLLLAVAGGLLLTALAVGRGVGSGPLLALAVLGGQAAVTVLGMRVDYARYHLPVLLAVAVCAGAALGWAWGAAVGVGRRLGMPRAGAPARPARASDAAGRVR
jgi:hypothetical protein